MTRFLAILVSTCGITLAAQAQDKPAPAPPEKPNVDVKPRVEDRGGIFKTEKLKTEEKAKTESKPMETVNADKTEFSKKVLELHTAYMKARGEAIKELEGLETKARADQKKAEMDMRAAKNAEDREKAHTEYKKAQEELRKISREKMDVERVRSFGMPPIQRQHERERLGVHVAPVSETLAAQLSLEKGKGVVIDHVTKDKAGEKAGLLIHDVIIRIADKEVAGDGSAFRIQVGEVKEETAIDVVVIRKGKSVTVSGVKLPAVPMPRP